jgi:hypothetical protein
MGGPTTGVTFTSHEWFRAENPKPFAAVTRAFEEPCQWINADKRARGQALGRNDKG